MNFIAYLGVLILFGLSIFQLLLILGKPLGDFAWGGQYTVLPRKFRVGSASSIILYGIFALFLVSKAGTANIITNSSLLSFGVWFIAAYLVLGIFMNAISRSKKERAVMTPVAFLLSVIFLMVALR